MAALLVAIVRRNVHNKSNLGYKTSKSTPNNILTESTEKIICFETMPYT